MIRPPRKAHVLICMLACYLTWHLRQAWAPLTFTAHTRTHPPRATTSPRPQLRGSSGFPGPRRAEPEGSGPGEAKAGQGVLVDDYRSGEGGARGAGGVGLWSLAG